MASGRREIYRERNDEIVRCFAEGGTYREASQEVGVHLSYVEKVLRARHAPRRRDGRGKVVDGLKCGKETDGTGPAKRTGLCCTCRGVM
jgi:hypothetical protein